MDSFFQPEIPDLMKARRILCVQPHYDDNDLAAGGTLAALSAAGVELYYLTVTDDLVGVVDPALTDEQARAFLEQDQQEAAAVIGVREHFCLGFPDAGKYDYFQMRNQIIRLVRYLRPDFLMTCDPWLPYEAHRDHVQTGLAVAEAAFLHQMTRLTVDPEIDRSYKPYSVQGVAFYLSQAPNTIIDISQFWDQKIRAVRCYRAQFTPEDTERMIQMLEIYSRLMGGPKGYALAEGFKVLSPDFLHANPFAWSL